MTALLITSFIILLSYILYAGVAESLSATYYKVKKPYLLQLALGLTGFLMMIYLLDMTAGKWYQFLSFFAFQHPFVIRCKRHEYQCRSGKETQKLIPFACCYVKQVNHH